ncbi:radical SAM protein [Planctomycetota bacterium]|nr:radical SAM protein [Planctomycetota bacterium]
MSWDEILKSAQRVEARNGVDYREVSCGRVLNRVDSREVSYLRSVNPYLNCEVGCTYCFARDVAGRRGDATEFSTSVYVKTESPRVFRQELARLAARGQISQPIGLGTATDPYQPVEKRQRLTRALLEELARHEGVVVSVYTQSDLVLRDLDLLQEINRHGHARVNVTLTTPCRNLARSLEPRAPTPELRLKAVQRLARAGVPVGVMCMPIIPEVTDSPRDLRSLVCDAQAAGASWFSSRVLFLRNESRQSFMGWLSKERPGLVAYFRRMYAKSNNAPEHVRDRIERVVSALRRQHGVCAEVPFPAIAGKGRQLPLFGPAVGAA